MHRLKKLLGIILIFCIVFFVICDEKGYKIGIENNHMVFNKVEKKSDFFQNNEISGNLGYKNSNLIRINPQFEKSDFLRNSDGMDPKYLAKMEELQKAEEERRLEEKRKLEEQKRLEKERKLEEEKKKKQEKVYTGGNIVALNKNDSISSVLKGSGTENNTGIIETTQKHATGDQINDSTTSNLPLENNEREVSDADIIDSVIYYPVEKYDYHLHVIYMFNGTKQVIEKSVINIDRSLLNKSGSFNLYKGQESSNESLYKISNRIRIYGGYKNPRNMRSSAGIVENTTFTGIIEKNIEDSVKENINEPEDNNTTLKQSNIEEKIETGTNLNQEIDSEIGGGIEIEDVQDMDLEKSDFGDLLDENEIIEDEIIENVITYKIKKYAYKTHSININEGRVKEPILISVERPGFYPHLINISDGKLPEKIFFKIKKYEPKINTFTLKMGKEIKHDFVVKSTEENGNLLSEEMLENLLQNDDIDINTLESKNDEFLQNVFEKTKDRNIMNFIIENYINEYQFVKAKKYIENLPEMYHGDINSLLNLRVAFNSFALTSKNTSENLTSLVQEYASGNKISQEDKNRYMGIISLIDQNYDNFFQISKNFSLENNVAFVAKLQGYKDQISKQMGMPEYYFDTLVSLELFNQGFFQPAKVLALYSLQQNSNYILPYQILAYANFLTNSRETSIEYLKKLVDLDPNNTEKYHFLMGVAYYRNEKYEQSVVMLSMIKDEKLRLDAQRYLINDYLKLDQKNKLIFSRNKLLGYENLVASDFYTYFYETFFRPYSEGAQFQLYAFDTELADKMLRVCNLRLSDNENMVCTYGSIGKNIALGQFEGLEQSLLNLATEYPQGYLYRALGEYYLKQDDLERAKIYLLKAMSFTQKGAEKKQIKKLLQSTL